MAERPVDYAHQAQYYWDTSLRAVASSLLRPAALRAWLVRILDDLGSLNRSNLLLATSGRLAGRYYAFNHVAVFEAVWRYVTVR